MSKKSKLPDFGMYFHTKSRSRIDFVCRCDPNLFHDLVFLGSYIHDAQVQIEKVRLRGKKLRIPMMRDRWELYQASRKLESIRANLNFGSVLFIKWESRGKRVQRQREFQPTNFIIRHIYLGEVFWDDSDKAEIILASHGKNPCKLRLITRDPFSIRLTDATKKK